MLSCNFSVNVGWFRHMLGSHLAQLDIMLMVRLVLCVCVFCTEHPQCYRRVPPQSCVPASVEEKTGFRLSGGGGALS